MSKRNHDEFASDYDLQFNFEQECECNLCFQADEEVSNPSNFNLPLEHYCDDSEYGNSYQYHDEQEEEEEDGMPDFECEEDMHRWMLKQRIATKSHFSRTSEINTRFC
ncbi:hypothetical protein FPQ18DRAFT_301000 [Pyronema domesticum]|nr:hypothetical protein FPQ18DRAFT_301000 [Pyronema domesticum]